jgi:dolichyl-phosphate beta-glucosyltransferase
MTLSIVIPAFNEEMRIIPTLESLRDDFIKNKSDIEILVGDDGSIDGTVRVVNEFARTNTWCRLIKRVKNRGKGAILRELVAESKGDIVLYTDADLPVNPLSFNQLIDPLLSGKADLVQVSRWLEDSPKVANVPVHRNIISQLFRLVTQKMKPKGITDTQCGCKAFNGDLARKLFSNLVIDGFAFDVELLLFAQAKGSFILEVPLQVRYIEGSSVKPINATLTMIRDLLRIKWKASSAKMDK